MRQRELPAVLECDARCLPVYNDSRHLFGPSPSEIELCFNEAVELKFSSVKLLDAGKIPVPLGEAKLGDDPKCIRAPVAMLKAGTYTVNYRVLSLDGHVVEYGYQFTVRPEPPLK